MPGNGWGKGEKEQRSGGAREQRGRGDKERGRQGDGEQGRRITFHFDALIAAAERCDPDEVRRLLKVLAPEYQLADG